MIELCIEKKILLLFLLFFICLIFGLDFVGYSDPYCMLGIQPGGTPISPLPPPMTPRTLSDVGFDNNLDSPQHSDKLRKHHSFRLSFKRKDGRREHRDSLNGPVPAKFIRATSIKPHTLSPKWHERFKLYVFSHSRTYSSLFHDISSSFFFSFVVFYVATSLVVLFLCCPAMCVCTLSFYVNASRAKKNSIWYPLEFSSAALTSHSVVAAAAVAVAAFAIYYLDCEFIISVT